jgi:diguanylate cyclase (GGDEF)-like protein
MAIKASYTDDLTGVANRRFVTARMEEMLARLTAGKTVLGCVCVLDLDNFKYINDRFGHLGSDIILRDFAMRIQREVRRSDCFGRIGGEEFLLVLPDTSTDAAEFIVERMLAAIRISRPLGESLKSAIPSRRESHPFRPATASLTFSPGLTWLSIPQKLPVAIAYI